MANKKNRKWGRWIATEPAFIESGQGRLYYVTDSSRELSGVYVLKELKNPKRINRFNTELQAIATLKDHPNVVPLVDAGIYRDEQKPCYVMPKADGTVEDLIKRNLPNREESLFIFDQICEGVAYIHKNFIIHRDLKPENILIFAGAPKVTDLGLCLIAGMERVTPQSEAVGPRFYMAPELEDGKRVDVSYAADVYSLGKVLYYLLANGKIFAREKHRNKDWYLPRLLDDKRLELFYSVFDKSIVVEPSKRYSNAGELQEAFRDIYIKYLNHPLSTLLKKFGTLTDVYFASESTLQNLTPDEWEELLKKAIEQEIAITQELIQAACSSLTNKFALPFAKALLENESRFDSSFVASASKRLLCLPEGDIWFLLWLDSVRFSHLALNALTQPDDEVVDKIASFNILTLRQCPNVLSKLAEHFSKFTNKAMQNFLIASVKVAYPQKEQLLLGLSRDEKIDNTSLEAVIAGLCACATTDTIKRVMELADRNEMDEKTAAIGRGIVMGSSVETSKTFAQHNWRSPVIKVLIDIMQRVEDKEATDSNETSGE